MAEFFQKFFNSKLTTAALVVGLVFAGAVIFGGVGGEPRSQKSASPAETATPPQSSGEIVGVGVEDAGGDELRPEEDGDPDSDVFAEEVALADDAAEPPEETERPTSPVGSAGAARPDPVRIAAAADQSGANSFNRLLKRPASAPNAAPARDGIHDPDNPGTGLLQWPSVAFESFPKTSDGNKVDWVKALAAGEIKPRYQVDNPNAEPFLLDLVIVRQVKGSMPNVVYPHLQHTQWLDCSNCHDEIFIPQKGANQISMAGILLGQKCGVCHGKVAFPVSDCRRCHALPKTEEELRALASRSSWTDDGGN